MPTYNYAVVIDATLNASGVKKGGDETRTALTGIEKAAEQHRNKLEQIKSVKQSKLEQIAKASNSKLEQLNRQHLNKVLEFQQKALADREKLLQKEAAKTYDAKAKELREQQKLAQQHQQKLEVLQLQHRNRLEQIAARGQTAYKNETTVLGGLKAGWTGVTTAVSGAIQAFDTVSVYARQGVETLFNLAKSASDAGSAIYEMSQQTGLSSETVSGLKFAADQTNVSMETLVTGINRFEKTLAEAARGNDNAKDSLIRLGIDPQKGLNDLQGSLEKVFKVINNAPEGTAQASAAVDAFGKSGAALIPIIKQANGDIQGLVQRATELGLVFDAKTAQAADDFGDSLTVLSKSAQGLAYTFGKELLPAVTGVMNDITYSIRSNQDVVRNWGRETGDVIKGTARLLQTDLVTALRISLQYGTQVGIVLTAIGKGLAWLGRGQTIGDLGRQTIDNQQQEWVDRNYDWRKAIQRTPYDTTGGNESGGRSKTAIEKALQDARDYRDIVAFTNQMGFMPGSTTDGRHNKGSLHYKGKAVDVSIKGKSAQEIFDFMAQALEQGYTVRDERLRPPGQKVWGGAHIHLSQGGKNYLPDARLQELAQQVGRDDFRFYLNLLGEDALVSTAGVGRAVASFNALEKARRTQAVTTTGQLSVTPFKARETPNEAFRRVRNESVAQDDVALNLRAANIEQEKFLAGQSKKISLENEYYDLEVRLSTLQQEQGDSYLENVRRTNMVTGERIDLEERLLRIGDEMATGGVNLALRQQVAIQEELLNLRKADHNAIENISRLQVQLASKGFYSPNQSNERVLQFLNQTKGITEIVSDVKIGVISSGFDYLSSSLDKLADKFGKAAGVARIFTTALGDLLKLKLTQLLAPLFGLNPGGGSNNNGGGFNLGSIFSGIFNGGRGGFPATTGGFAGGFPIFGLGTGAASGGIPYGLSDIAATATRPRIAGQQSILQQLTSGFGGLGSSLGLAAPFLGLGLGAGIGAGLGQGNTGASILGAVGLGGVGLVGGTALPSILAGSFAGFTALGAATLGIGAVLAIGAYIWGKNSARRRDERTRNQAMLDAFSQLDSLIEDVKRDRTDGQSAIQQANQIRAAYLQQMSQLKDAKTRRIALADVSRIDAKIAILKAEADKQKARQARSAAIVPTFASGGFVGSSGGGYNGRIPGVYDRADNRMIRVSGNEVVLNPKQYAPIIPYMQAIKVPGFASGGATSQGTQGATNASLLNANFEIYVNVADNAITMDIMQKGDVRKQLLQTVTIDLAAAMDNNPAHPVIRAAERATGRARA